MTEQSITTMVRGLYELECQLSKHLSAAEEEKAMSKRKPVDTLEVLSTLNEAEIVEGYYDGYKGWAEPGDNQSLSYWHGWCNGAADGGHMLR